MTSPPPYDPGYRSHCDECGEDLEPRPQLLRLTRQVAQDHADATGHAVRVEPAETYALVDLIRPREPELDYADPSDEL